MRRSNNPSVFLRRLSLLVAFSIVILAEGGGVIARKPHLGAKTSDTKPAPAKAQTSSGTTASAEIRHFKISANDVVYDPVGQMLYASVPSSFGKTGNSVMQINPKTLTVGPPIWVGSEPGKMTVSEDGKWLHLALDGAKAVRRVDLTSQSAGLQFWMGNRLTNGATIPIIEGPYHAADLKAMPGRPASVAVLGNGPTIYHDGVKLAEGRGATDYPVQPYLLAFSDSTSKLYGLSENGDFFTYDINENGVSMSKVTHCFALFESSIGCRSGPFMEFGGGLVYTSTGLVIDPEVPKVVRTFSLPESVFPVGLIPEPQTGRLYALAVPNSCLSKCAKIYALNLSDMSVIDSIDVPGVTGDPRSFIRWGSNGFAFRTGINGVSGTSLDQVFVIRSSLVPSAAPIDLPEPTQTSRVDPPVFPSTIRQIALPNTDLILDELRGLIYASVPEFAGANGNSIMPLNPVAGELGIPRPIGINPGKMAISRDGKFLYTSLISEENVRRLNLLSNTVDAEFNVKYAPTVPTFIYDMVVMPEDPGALVLARSSSLNRYHQGLGILVYKNGTLHTQGFAGGQSGHTVLETSDEPSVFYASDICCGPNYVKMKIGADGSNPYSPIYVADNLLGGRGADIKWSGGLLFDNAGRVTDPQQIRLLGTFTISREPELLLADAKSGNAYFLHNPFPSFYESTWKLTVYDTRTFLPRGIIDIPGVRGGAGSLLRWGNDGLAFGTAGNQIFLIQSPLFKSYNKIDDAPTFVSQHYLDFLNRGPDTSGLNFWTNALASCGSDEQCLEAKRSEVSAAFYLSIEFQQTGYLVERIYKAAYGNASGTSTLGGTHQLEVPIVRFEEFLSDTQKIGQGVIVNQGNWRQQLEINKQAFTAEFVARSRFTEARPPSMTPAQFVDTLNGNAGNPLSQSERDQLVNALSTNAKTRAQVLRAIAEDPDLNSAEFNRAFVLMQYFGYLRRNPNDTQDTDYTGFDFWLTKLNQFNGNYLAAEMVKAFINSSEYRRRFGP